MKKKSQVRKFIIQYVQCTSEDWLKKAESLVQCLRLVKVIWTSDKFTELCLIYIDKILIKNFKCTTSKERTL